MFLLPLQNLHLHLNETKSETENASNRKHFDFAVNKNLKCDERAMFRVSLKNLDFYLTL